MRPGQPEPIPPADHSKAAAALARPESGATVSRSIRKAEVWLVGDRNFPHGKFTLRENVADLPELLAACQRLQPDLDVKGLLEAIWHYGLKGVRHRQQHHPARAASFALRTRSI